MHIGAGAQLVGMNLRVCHPIELVDQAYERAGYYNDAVAQPQKGSASNRAV
jgi:hypothetical protein